jgi:SEL1 protein
VTSEAIVDHSPFEDLSQLLEPGFVPNDEQRNIYESQGGNDAVHEVWSILRDFEPTWKNSVIAAGSSDLVSVAWYYTKVVLKALFMSTPANAKDSSLQDDGDKATGDLKKAIDILEAAAKFDDPDAIFLLAEMNLHGNFSHPRNPTKALEWYALLADLDGNSTAQYALGLLYATGIGGVERDQAKSLLYHSFAAEQGNIRSEMTLGYRHHAGIGVPRDCNTAVNYYKRVADKAMKFWESGPPAGYAYPRNSYRWVEETGGIYGEGASVSSAGNNAKHDTLASKDIDGLFEYYSMQESAGDYRAAFILGRNYYDPPRGYKRNLRKAQRQFMKVARAYWGKDGKVNAKLPKNIESVAGKAAAFIGRMFLRGEGMDQNYDKAITWFRRGISNGEAFAQYHMGIVYRDGLGLQQDGIRAATYLKTAADQGLAIAQSALGVLFLDQGDIETASRYFEIAAANGVMEAMYYLAELNNNGAGRDRNCGLATIYYKIVAEKAEPLHSSIIEANLAFEHGDYERAFIPSLMAAEQGYEHAQANVAHLLDRKTSVMSISGIPLLSSPSLASTRSRLLNNPALALALYTRSAKQQNVDSLIKAGDYYLAGHSTTSAPLTLQSTAEAPNLEKATTCYQTAAEAHRSAQALWNMGWMHENGIGSVTQDFHMAKRYYDLAYEMNKEAYLPVKLALIKLRIRSWWNGVSGGKVNGIKDDDVDESRPKTFMEWLYKFLDAAEEMDAAEAAQMAQQDEMDALYNEPGMPGGDSEYAARERERAAGDEFAGEWDDFDDGLVESLVIISLAGALAALVYARQQAQRRREEDMRRGVGQGQAAQTQQAPGQQQQQQQQQQNPPANPAPPPDDRGMFPPPDDPNFNNWVAGGVGH